MTVSVTWRRALAWRMRRQMLEPVEERSVESVVGRLGAVQAQDDFAAELSVNTRRADSSPGDVAAALTDGRLIRTFAFRGATHLMTPEDGAIYLAVRASSRMWELPSWQSYYGLKPSDWPAFRASVREALANGPLTRQQLGAAVAAQARFRHLGFAFEGENWTLLKPLAWQGDMCFDPSVKGRASFQRLDTNPRWPGLAAIDEAGPRAVKAYFAAYGPATSKHVNYWLGEGLGAGRRRIAEWIARLGDGLAEIDVEGVTALVLREHVDDLRAAPETTAVRLLPAYDQWLMGPGTADAHVTPPARRALVTRGANVLVASGTVSGTWTLSGRNVVVDWFVEAGAVPREALDAEIRRLGEVLGHELLPA